MRLEFNGKTDDIPFDKKVKIDFKLKSRDEHVAELMDPNTEYDMLIIGSGASGSGVALEAVSRGLKVAVIDKYDFGSGTSSRSTKLAHGGIRYFQ
jgi:glycerol-3-phosphate dehydrogenase